MPGACQNLRSASEQSEVITIPSVNFDVGEFEPLGGFENGQFPGIVNLNMNLIKSAHDLCSLC